MSTWSNIFLNIFRLSSRTAKGVALSNTFEEVVSSDVERWEVCKNQLVTVLKLKADVVDVQRSHRVLRYLLQATVCSVLLARLATKRPAPNRSNSPEGSVPDASTTSASTLDDVPPDQASGSGVEEEEDGSAVAKAPSKLWHGALVLSMLVTVFAHKSSADRKRLCMFMHLLHILMAANLRLKHRRSRASPPSSYVDDYMRIMVAEAAMLAYVPLYM